MEKKESSDKVVEKPVKKTVASEIWEEIKDKKIEMFALPDQTVKMYCKPVDIEPTKLYVTVSAPAAFPALDLALSNKFVVERVDRWVTISKK